MFGEQFPERLPSVPKEILANFREGDRLRSLRQDFLLVAADEDWGLAYYGKGQSDGFVKPNFKILSGSYSQLTKPLMLMIDPGKFRKLIVHEDITGLRGVGFSWYTGNTSYDECDCIMTI